MPPAAPGIQTQTWFPDYPETSFPAGKLVRDTWHAELWAVEHCKFVYLSYSRGCPELTGGWNSHIETSTAPVLLLPNSAFLSCQVEVDVGFHNGGSSPVNVTGVAGSLNSKESFQYYQNFTFQARGWLAF